MRHVMAALVAIAVIAAAAATGAAGSSTGGGPYGQAHTWATPLGEVYGPVHAGPDASTSYGFVAK